MPTPGLQKATAFVLEGNGGEFAVSWDGVVNGSKRLLHNTMLRFTLEIGPTNATFEVLFGSFLVIVSCAALYHNKSDI